MVRSFKRRLWSDDMARYLMTFSLIRIDGARYEGEWSQNRAHGKGKFWHVDGDTCNLYIFMIKMKGNGKWIKLRAMEFIYIWMELSMKDIGKMTFKMGTGWNLGKMEVNMMVITGKV